MTQTLILASQSPRRQQLLEQLGYQFKCLPANIDESILANESAQQYVTRLALAKAKCIAKNQPDSSLVLGCDTSVVINQQILGKPTSEADCLRILGLLSGKVHQVQTAVSLVNAEFSKTVLVTTEVEFKVLSHSEIKQYWLTGEPQDKAGAYGIQGIGGQFVKHIAGSYSAVVGLPLYQTVQLLNDCGLPSVMNLATLSRN
jgi:septum formation protein